MTRKSGQQQEAELGEELNIFETLNTRDAPVTMKEGELSICQNFIPIGTSIYTIPGISTPKATIGTSESAWADTTAYSQYDVVIPTSYNGFMYVCTTAGTSDATEPLWPTTQADTVVDGTAIWTCYSLQVMKMYSATIGTSIFTFVVTEGGALYVLTSSFTETRLSTSTLVVAFVNPRFEQWKNERILIADTSGYYHSTETTLTNVNTNPYNCIAVFATRVWLGNVRTISYTAPDTYDDFASAGSGSLVDTYASLGQQMQAFASTQEYLYIIGDHGTHMVYGVQLLDTGATTFNLSDSLPGIGTIWPETVVVFGGAVFLTSDTGMWAIQGTATDQFTGYLDGALRTVSTTFNPIGSLIKIYNKLCYCVLVKYADPLDNLEKKAIWAVYEGRAFTHVHPSSYDFSSLSTQKNNTGDVPLISYGTSVCQLFQGSVAVTKKVRSRATNFREPFKYKVITRAGVELTNIYGIAEVFVGKIRIYGDLESGEADVSFDTGAVQWINNLQETVLWTNSSLVFVPWLFVLSTLLGAAVTSGRGKRIQIDFEDTSLLNYVLSGLLMQGIYGAEW